MPITKYTGANLKKLKKDRLIGHIIDLYEFIDLFDFHKLTEENEKLKEENHGFIQLSKSLQDEVKGLRETMGEPANVFGSRVWDILYDEDYCPTSYGEGVSFIKDIIKENEKYQNLKEENEKLQKEKFDYNVFAEEKTNMSVLLSKTARENEKLKEEIATLKKNLKI